MKQKLLLLFAVLAMAVNASAGDGYDFSAENAGVTIYYNITSSSEPYTVEVTYKTTSYNSYSGDVKIPESVTKDEITYSVTKVGHNAFYGCTDLTSVTIPSSVTTICFGAFINCSGLTSITIPNSVKEIQYSAFYGCKGLTKVNIPESVTTIGNYPFYNCSNLQSFTGKFASSDNRCLIDDSNVLKAFAPSGLTSYEIPSSVKTIGSLVFYNCTALTSVKIPSTVTTIESSAFNGCTALTSLTIPSAVTSIGDKAFYKCSSMPSVEIPNKVTTIGQYAFYGCTALTSVEIPNKVTAIKQFTFYGCTALTSVKIPSSITLITGSVFKNCTSLKEITSLKTTPPTAYSSTFENVPATCKVIVPNADAVTTYKAATGWSNLNVLYANQIIYYTSSDGDVVTPYKTDVFGADITSNDYADGQGMIVFDADVTSIGNNAFYNRTSLTSVTIPNSVTSIGESAFSGCSKLTSVDIPETVTSIGNSAFYYCEKLTSVTIPNSVTSIGTSAFNKCIGMTSVTIGNSVETIGSYAFYDCEKLTSVTIPSSVTSIGNRAFYLCKGLKSVTIPGKVTSIGEYVFYQCSGLTSVTIPNSVTSIGKSAFDQCTSLKSVTIPNSVSSLGNYAFNGCTSLAEVTSLATTAPSIGENCFLSAPAGLVIKVPGAAIGDYYTAWSAYADKLQAISLALTDGTEYTYNFSFESGTTTYTRNFTKDCWQALFLPFAMSYSDWSSYGTVAELTGVSNGVLQWTTIESGSIEAGKPYIFKPNGTGKVTFTVNSANMQSCETINPVAYTVTEGTYTLSGTYTTKTDMATIKGYALSDGNFYYTTNNSKALKPYRIFLTVPTPSSAPVRSIIDGVEVTAIEGINVDIDNHSQKRYNLQGVRVDDCYRGIVIINGKKVLRK